MTRRCKATSRRFDETLRCEAPAGHDSVHYSGNVWWPNRNGFPYERKKQNTVLAVAWVIAAASVIGAVLFVILTR